MVNSQNEKTLPTWFRWVAVLPGAAVAALLVLFPLHWILRLKAAFGGSILGFIELSPRAFETIEVFLTPFVIAITFVITGFEIAPTHKFKAAVALAITFVAFAIGLMIYASKLGVPLVFEARSVGSILGVAGGLFYAWHKNKLNTGVTAGSMTGNQDY